MVRSTTLYCCLLDILLKLELYAVIELVLIPLSPDSGKSYKLGIDKSIFVKPATFHLTLLVLKLWNEERVQAAADRLQLCHFPSWFKWTFFFSLVFITWMLCAESDASSS